MHKKSLQKTSGFSIWLLPDDRTDNIFNNVILRLSEKFSTPLFTPHLTLSGTPEDSDPGRLQSIIDRIADVRPVFSVYTNKLVCGTPPFRRFYVHIEPVAELLSLAAECNELLNGSYSGKDNFHFSLMYGFTDCERIQNYIREADIMIPKGLHIQKIAVMDITGLPWEWKIIYSRNLLT